eukprot:3932435-Rhodomonas_salina.5
MFLLLMEHAPLLCSLLRRPAPSPIARHHSIARRVFSPSASVDQRLIALESTLVYHTCPSRHQSVLDQDRSDTKQGWICSWSVRKTTLRPTQHAQPHSDNGIKEAFRKLAETNYAELGSQCTSLVNVVGSCR